VVNIAIVTIELAKEALKIDYDDEDTFLGLCIEAAEVHLEGAIDDYSTKIEDEKFIKMAKIVILMTVQSLFDNRVFSNDVSSSAASEKIKYIISSFMAQMRWS